jgi:signal transduction histidine kinase
VALGLAIIVAFTFANGITVPIRKLVEGAKMISSGNFAHRISVKTKDEIGMLAEAFNMMTRKIEKWNEELEKTVKERTLELELTNKRLAELNEMRTEFLNMATHELRTPITAIKGYSEFLKLGMMGELNAKQVNAVTIIKESGERLLALINDMLDLAKMEAGKLQVELEPVRVIEVIDINLKLIKPLADEKNIELKSSIESDLPKVYADKDKLSQVFTNLLSNAVKYTEEGTITVAAQQISSTMIQVSVADTGVGIPEEDVGKVFEKFTKIGNKPTRKEKGTGLGLPITKLIVDAFGGKIWVESEEGKGSIFSFTVPIYEGDEEI